MTRSGKELLNATRPFVERSHLQSWLYVGSTLAIVIASLAVAGLAPWWPLRLAASILGGIVMSRAFILYHDYMHGSILKDSRLAKPVIYAIGLLMLAPPRSWRYSHNYHHAHVGKLNVMAVGSYPIMSTDAWHVASRSERFKYRLSRHPLTILFAIVTIFALTITIEPLLKNPKKNWDSALALLVNGGLIAGLWILGGFSTAFFVFMLPFALGAALGAYLFYAQHSFPGINMLPQAGWDYYQAALESSSYMKLGRTMAWATGNIGYHHVHHLNPSIPFYRLPEAMAGIPELQDPAFTTLRPHHIIACMRANLWDEDASRMVSFREAARAGLSISLHLRRAQSIIQTVVELTETA